MLSALTPASAYRGRDSAIRQQVHIARHITIVSHITQLLHLERNREPC